MADAKTNTPTMERPLPNVAIQHRLNHIAFGSLGRLAYSPVDADDQPVGRLQTSRSADSNQHVGQVSRFAEVLPPTRSALADELFAQKPSDAARSQKNWLLETYPEAVAGGDLDVRNLADELRALKSAASEDGGGTTSSLLAVGEITNRTDVHSGTVGQPAIAMAAGEGGHVLRIVPLDHDNSVWTGEDLSVRLTRVSSSARGDWSGDGVPITLIKFAIDGRRYDPIRWLLVQRPTGTALLEPEVNVMPFQAGISEYEQSHLYSQMPRYIAVNHLFTIPATKTGGNAHVDACFNPAVQGRFPQLAIIDKLGHWTICDITGSRSAAPKIPQPIVTARGSIDVGPKPSLQTMLGKDSASHKLLYVLPKGERRVKRDYQQEDTEHLGLYSRSPIRCMHLLVCTDTDVRLFDASHGTQLAGIRVVNVNRAERIVDMQSCPVSASQALVLTTSSLYWIEAKVTRHGQARIGVICSFPHDRGPEGGGLVLSVCSMASSGLSQSLAAFVVSAEEKATDLFILTRPTSEEVAHGVHQVVRADLPRSIRSILTAACPAERNGNGKAKSTQPSSRLSQPLDRRVFQLFGLKSDLSLGMALFVSSDLPLQDQGVSYSIHGETQSDKLRKKFLRLLGNAFVVPESYDDRPETSLSDSENEHHETDLEEKLVTKHDVMDLQAAYERLNELVASEITPAKMSRQLLAGVIHQRGMEELGDSDYMRIRTL